MTKKKHRAHGVYIETALFDSDAYKSLTKAEMRIYFEFLLKRRFGKIKGKPGKRKNNKVITNNGEITFSYAEAETKGYSRAAFRRAIDKFVSAGLIDIAHQGTGGMIGENGKITGEPSMYAISERWKHYGTESFEVQTRPKDKRSGRGWGVYHARKRSEKQM